ncbi:MAG: hypothetical protein P4L57_11185 [Rhizomicrobium sp.]|nr:hypothetical protein [Rhizomicrobium sp.]
MRSSVFGIALIGLAAVGLAACGGGRKEPPGPPRAEEWHAPISILRHFAGPDGGLTRKQLEEGLRRDFNAADTNHDGVLQPDEMRAVNQQRWMEDQSAISPLQDWNGDGVIDFNEFSATARALFNEADRDGKGVITAEQLRMRKPGADTTPAKSDPEQGGQPRKRRGGQPQGGGPGG